MVFDWPMADGGSAYHLRCSTSPVAFHLFPSLNLRPVMLNSKIWAWDASSSVPLKAVIGGDVLFPKSSIPPAPALSRGSGGPRNCTQNLFPAFSCGGLPLPNGSRRTIRHPFKIAPGHDVDAISLFIRLAVRRAGVIYPLGLVPADRWVNHFAIVQPEELCVVRILRIGVRHLDRLLPRDPSPGVFDNSLAFADRTRGEDSPSMNARAADFDG